MSLRVHNLGKCYPAFARPAERLRHLLWRQEQEAEGFWALKDVSFSLPQGGSLGIVGKNGSGKSTLLQLVAGTLAASAGSVEVRGRIAPLLELGTGFNSEFSGRENVYLNGALLGLSQDEIGARFDSIASFADIGEFIDQPVKTYSSGMYVRLAFAVAINVDPDILVVDEALSVGDEAFQRKCFARIDSIRKRGATVLFVSHAGSTVTELCNRALLLDRGELLTIGSPKFVISRYQKILYSPADKYLSIRESIRREVKPEAASTDEAQEAADPYCEGTPSPSDQSPRLAGDPDGGSDMPRAQDGPEALDESFFEEGLVPKSIFRYDAFGASIVDPHIETLLGRRVNILQPMREYIYTYTVRFDRAASAVRCGMLIKSVTGLELAGCVTSWHGDSLPDIPADSEVVVRFKFPCMFASGAYFLNAGVQGLVGEEHVYLDRWIDGAMFKVIHEPGRLATTTMDLNIDPQVHVTASVVAP